LVSAYRLIPNVDGQSQEQLDLLPGPRVIKSHYSFDPIYKRVIYVVRDPRDVVLSQYHYQRKRRVLEDDYPLEKFVSRFLAGDVCPYGSWGENVSSWLAARSGDPNFLCIRYEDLKHDTETLVARLARHLGIPSELAVVRQTIERSSVERMRQLEKHEAHLWASTRDTRKDISFMRVGTSGEWQTDLPASCVSELEAKWSAIMGHLGYLSDTDEKHPKPAWLSDHPALTVPIQ
jgi:hypothetical protein